MNYQLSVIPRFPARVVGGAGIAITKANGVYTISQTGPHGDIVDVRDYGAVGDGVTDDTAALLAAVADGMARGRPVYAPAGVYPFSQQLLFDYGSPGLEEGSKCGLIGESPSLTHFLWTGGATADAAIKMKGTTAIDFSPITGFTIRPNVASQYKTIGLWLEMRSYSFLERICVLEMTIGIFLKDVILSTLNQCVTSWNGYGIATRDGARSSCNGVTLNDCTCANNLTVGWQFNNGTYIIHGGSISGNGTTLDAAGEGGLVFTAEDATALGAQPTSLCMEGVYIEANAGRADIYIIHNDPAAHTYAMRSCLFNRIGTRFATNCIRCEFNDNGDAHLALDACTFTHDPSSYAPVAGRQYIARTGASFGRLMYDLRPSTVFFSATESTGFFTVNYMGRGTNMTFQPSGSPAFQVLSVPASINWMAISGAAAGAAASISALSNNPDADFRIVPKGTGVLELPLANVPDFANDAAAAVGGVVVGGFYRTANALKIRVV